MRRSLFANARWRLVAWNVAVFAVLLTALGIAAYRAFSSTIYTEVDSQLRDRQALILSKLPEANYDTNVLFGANPALAEAPYRVLIGDPSGLINQDPTACPTFSPYSYPPPCPPDSLTPASKEGIYTALDKGTDLRTDYFVHHGWERVLTFQVLINDSVAYIVQISRDASGQESALHTLRLLLIFGAVGGVILSGLGSIFLANRALVPIRQAFGRQRQFTADASHELRTPLSLIRANAEMLSRHGDRFPPGDGDLVHEIIRETDHLNRMVGDLLTLARADTETLKLSIQPVDFRLLVSEVHEDLYRVAETQGIGTSLSLNGPVTVSGDETRLRQLLLILLDNALKYTDPGGKVTVSVGREEHRARLVISDTGIGIPSGDLPHIFERFYRVDRAREHESGGTGLGLAIARWIVQAHHGSIRVDSEQGKGARFQVDLPVA